MIEFFPEKAVVVRYSCWMGMIHGAITVVDNAGLPSAAAVSSEAVVPASSCCGVPADNTDIASCCGVQSSALLNLLSITQILLNFSLI